MIFLYKGFDQAGKRLKSRIEAASLAEAKAKIKTQKIIIETISQERESLFGNVSLTMKKKIAPKELSSLCRELSMYIRSGISIVSAVKIVQSHYQKDKKMRLFLQSISTSLDEGKDFYTALESQDVLLLPEFFKHSIKVSENGGMLDEVLMELSRFLKEQERIAKEIKGAFAYPSFMIIISLFMIAFMLAYVVPEITGIFTSMHQELPKPTRFVIAMGDFFNQNYQLLLATLFISTALFVIAKKKIYTFAYMVDKALLHMPYFGTIIQKSELARFAYMASLLVRSGVPFVQTINLASNILNNRVLKELFQNASKEVVEGKLLSHAINNTKYIDHAFVQSIALGEETSQLQNVLINISELYFEENRDKISMLLTLLEPSLMLFVGGSIGFIVAAMLLPIFSMSIG